MTTRRRSASSRIQGLDYIAVGRHAGASRTRKLLALLGRTTKLHRWARGSFDLAVAHGSNDLALAAAWAGIPAVNMFDYEFAIQQHNIGCRLARRVIVPDAIPPSRLTRFGVSPSKLVQYPGLKEEYYLADFEPDRTILERLGSTAAAWSSSSARRRTSRSITASPTPSFPACSATSAPATTCRRWCCPAPRPSAQQVKALALPSVIVTEGAVDAQSLIAAPTWSSRPAAA